MNLVLLKEFNCGKQIVHTLAVFQQKLWTSLHNFIYVYTVQLTAKFILLCAIYVYAVSTFI